MCVTWSTAEAACVALGEGMKEALFFTGAVLLMCPGFRG